MAEPARKITVSQSAHDEDNLPLPPPPPVPPRPFDYEGPFALSNLPHPPPKESFSSIQQQRQKSELKRLFKHIHPDLRASLDDVDDDEIMKALQQENTQAADAAYQCEVQSMRWIFENWTLDNIGDHPHETKKLLDDEELTGGNVRGTSSMFEHIDSTQQMSAKRQTSVRGDVRTSTWLFESQPLDSLNKLKREEGELVEAVLKDSIQPGDVTGARLLFESKPLSTLGRCNSIEDYSFLKLRSELQEQKGDVQKTVKLFQAEPCCAIKDNRGNIHEIKSICREEINSSNISTARWLFETQPLDLINKGTDGVKIIRGISLEEGNRGGVDQKRWMFETQSFDTIQEVIGEDMFEGMVDESTGEADVLNKRKLFEMQPLAALKGDSEEKPLEKEEIIAGDVKTSMWLFETQPMETLNDSYEVGRLKKVTLSAEEQGEVKGKKQMIERCSTQKNTQSKEQEIEKGDVKGFKNLFETIPLSKIAHSDEEIIEEEKSIAAGNVKGNKAMFETTPLYAIKDSSGNLHTVTTVSREELIKGKVQNYKWMFETKPLDKLAEGKGNVEVIKGITRQEDMMADVNMAKWLFETQTIDGIHSKFNQKEQDASVEEEPRKGDVKKCTWLFETQPMDILYDKSEKVNAKEAIDKTNVKSITWLFESQPLESIKDGEEYNLKLCNTIKDSVKSEVGVQTVKHVFETEPLDSIRKDANSEHNERRVSQVNFQSGDVSRVKELFESQSIDEIGSVMVTSNEQNQDEHLEKGSVHKCTWMFENCPMNQMNEDNEDGSIRRVSTVEGGDVQNKRFIFETSSLDKIHNQPLELMSDSVEEPPSNVDVKSSTMLFESLPLYAIRDKEGQFHEVTTVKKEEVMSGDVRGARWMFETKPLDAIKAEKEVYVIRAVTQEDVKKGGVKSARWKFETQPLDSLTSRDESSVRVIEDFGSNNVQLNKQIFESEKSCQKFTRMVSVTDVQQGDVRTSTWLFENQTIDSLKGELQEQGPVQAVHREDSQKGDVKRCTWLFESQPLDKIKEPEDTSVQGTEEEMPKSDVKCTTWLFETTPLDKITANSIADTLSYLYQMTFVHSSGIIIEANESRNVNMAKYQLESNKGVQIQKEEVVGGNIRNIMSQLLLKPTLKPQVSLLREVEKGKVNTTVVELPVYHSSTTINLERDTRIQNIVQMIDEFLSEDKDLKNGIIMQETAGGQAEMSVYSLICNSETKTESHVIEKGDVRSTIGNLLATANSQRTAVSCRVDENEKGNVNLYKSCIEKGDLNYLKSLHTEAIGDEVDHCHLSEEPLEIVQGDVKEAMRNLCQQKEQVERTISDVLPGDVKNTKKVFLTECPLGVENYHPKEEIIPGDILSAKQQLALMQHAVVEKEEIVAGDIKATMQSLERAKKQSMCVEREIVKPGTIYDMNLSGPEIEGSQAQKEVILAGDVKAAKKSLEFAKQQSLHLEREVIVPGKIYNLNVTAEEESSSTVMQSACSSTSRSQQTKTYPKTTENETEEVRGDVRAAIRSLQSAATEQKLLDKEDIRVRVINDSDSDHKQTNNTTAQQHQSHPKDERNTDDAQQTSKTKTSHVQQNEKPHKIEDKVVLREKKGRETDDQRRQRLSVHKEEIMKENEKAASEIFENLRKREELKGILSQVQEMEGETLYETVPAWMVTQGGNAKQSKTGEKKVEVETQDDDLESISSVETAFEDLEKASKEIMNLKEETLAKLLDIEETIKKALYSVSNLKSEADIAGLSGLFDESLKTEQSFQPANNIRKISIGSSKIKSSQIKEASVGNLQTYSDSNPSKQEVRRQVHNRPLIRQSSSQSSPSFISIHSAARKPVEQPKSPMSTFKPKGDSESCHDANSDRGHEFAVPLKNGHSPAQRKVSVLEVKTVPEQPAGIVGTKTVSETYEETDGFGNVFVSSVTSTFVTKQSESKPSALFEVVGNPTKYEVMTSPLIRRSARPFEEKVLSTANNEGTVFVTFSQPKEKL
ncbi:hypothetical protein NQZ68_035539 [Dissostichus eleginoides]|nr:hypothetical protein NQZ68_035539 [Dissostichus eleginoides]